MSTPTLRDVGVEWITLIETEHPALHRVLLAAMTPGDKSYLADRAVRLLKPTGSLYMHCGPTMSQYLKLVMDAVFGRKCFRNEVGWRYKKYQKAKIRFLKSSANPLHERHFAGGCSGPRNPHTCGTS